jgi:hypothetical protein
MISPRQRLVLEAGAPFLFIDQLVAQAPAAQVRGEMSEGKLQILISVSRQWRAPK